MESVSLPIYFAKKRLTLHIVGLGGSGGELLENIVRIEMVLKELGHEGFEIHLYDFDKVSHSNLGRTKFSIQDVGYYKSDVLAQKYNLYYGLTITSHPVQYALNNALDADFVLTCTDSAQFRIDMGIKSQELRQEKNLKRSVFWLDLGNSYRSGQYVLGHFVTGSDEPVLPNIYDLYSPELIEAQENEVNKSSCSLLEAVSIQDIGINKAVAIHSSNLLFQFFREPEISVHGGFVDLLNHEVNPLKINQKVWDFLGFESVS